MFKFWSGSREQQETSRESRYPSFVAGSSSNTSHLSTANSSSGLSTQRISDQPQTSHGQVSPSEAAGIIARLKDKSVDELQKLLNYEDAYNEFLHSFDQVKIQNDVGDELRNETTQLARKNLEKEPWVLELRNQCRIIRTTKLAAAEEKLNKLERNKDENLRFSSILLLLRRMQDAMNSMDEESEVLHRRLLDEEIDLKTFIQKYKKLRTIYHQRSLLHFAAKMSAG